MRGLPRELWVLIAAAFIVALGYGIIAFPTGILGADWPTAATKIYEAMQLALVGGQTPQQALDQVVGK